MSASTPVTDGTARTNLEFKARLADMEAAIRAAEALKAEDAGVLEQIDTYFKAFHGRLKLREINGTEAQLIAYDRQEDAAQRWSHFRVTSVADAEGMKAVLSDSLGVRGIVAKRREVYLWQQCRIHLDRVADLGDFLEFEVLSDGNSCDDWDRMEALMTAFGLSESDALKASYSDLLGL